LKLSIVVPFHNEEDVLTPFVRELTRVLDGLDVDVEVILVDDGSTDSTWEKIVTTFGEDARFRGIRFSRNFGHQAALSAGLVAAEGDAVITMDGDLQHPPSVIPELLRTAGEGYDVVYAVRSGTDAEGFGKRRVADAFYWVLNKTSTLGLPAGAADFRYTSRRVVDELVRMPERQRFLRGLTRWVGFDQTFIAYDRGPRAAGSTKYSARKMLGLAWDGLASFSAAPLLLATWVGFATSLLGWLYLVYVLVVTAFTTQVVPGWTSVIAAVLILGGVQLLCLGIAGQYLGRVFLEVKGRPLYVVREELRRVADGADALSVRG
jgi:dolichol-phosphate mannosyltransferase